jgi:putative Mg2+ transporter-C (MgtC) family protein
VGFLGGGVILRDGLNVRGINTSATLWCAAAVGCLCASLVSQGADQPQLEAAVSRLSLEPEVSALSWEVVEDGAAGAERSGLYHCVGDRSAWWTRLDHLRRAASPPRPVTARG